MTRKPITTLVQLTTECKYLINASNVFLRIYYQNSLVFLLNQLNGQKGYCQSRSSIHLANTFCCVLMTISLKHGSQGIYHIEKTIISQWGSSGKVGRLKPVGFCWTTLLVLEVIRSTCASWLAAAVYIFVQSTDDLSITQSLKTKVRRNNERTTLQSISWVEPD